MAMLAPSQGKPPAPPTAKPVQVPRSSGKNTNTKQAPATVGSGAAGTPIIPPASNIRTLSPKQIKNQAVKSVAAAYKPIYSSINAQTKQAQGLAEKRSADDQAYQTWMANQSQALAATAQQQDTALGNLESSIQGQINNQLPGQMAGNAQATTGNVSNMGMSNDFGGPNSLMGNLQAGANLQTLGALQAVTGQRGINQGALTAATGNNEAIIANDQQAVQSDLTKSLTQLQTTLATDQQNQAKDTISQMNTENTNNLSSAEHNQSYNLSRISAIDTLRQNALDNHYKQLAANQGQEKINLAGQQQTFSDRLASAEQQLKTVTENAAISHTARSDALAALVAAETYGLNSQKTQAYINHLQNSDHATNVANAIRQLEANTQAKNANSTWVRTQAEVSHYANADQTARLNAQIRDYQVKYEKQIDEGKLADAQQTLAIARQKLKASGNTGGITLTGSEANTISSRIDAVTGQVNEMLASGLKMPQIRNYLANGGQYTVSSRNSANKPVTKVVHVKGTGKADPITWAGFNLSNGGQGLTAKDIQMLNGLGFGQTEIANAGYRLQK